MGVAGLWDVLRPAAQPRSLSHLALDAFDRPLRGFRIGIDASIWFFHAAHGKEGENPELRTLFFRCCRLMHTPFLPLFVFDGPKRPDVKRGKRIGKEAHWMTGGMKNIIEAFGYEWRTAPGEAEAELAYLNRVGVIDGILSDDVDNFLFGATFVIRNPSPNLTGNTNHPLPTPNHTSTFSLPRIQAHPRVRLSRGGLILIALLAGGDYHKGVEGCGMKVAVALARCGFGESLLDAVGRLVGVDDGEGVDGEGRRELEEWLVGWREDVARELATNSQGHLPSKRLALSKTLLSYNTPASAPVPSTSKPKPKPTTTFPDLRILLYYTTPLTSETYHRSARNKIEIDWTKGEPDLGKIAGVCELYFEWGWKSMIVKRFKTLIWKGAVCRILRRAVITTDRKAAKNTTITNNNKNASNPTTPTKNNYIHTYTTPIRKDSECGTPSKMIAKHFSSLSLAGGGASPSKRPLSPSHYDHSRAFSLSSDRESDASDPSDEDENEKREKGKPGKRKKQAEEALITKIHSSRTHKTMDNLPEYRLEIAPAQLVRLVEGGIKGTRVEPEVDDIYADHEDEDDEDEDGDGDDEGFDCDSDEGEGAERGAGAKKKAKKAKGKEKGVEKPPANPNNHLRVWMPACMVKLVEPGLVEDFEEGLRLRAEKKAGRGKGKGDKATKGASKKSKATKSLGGHVDVSGDDSMDSDNVRNNLKGHFALALAKPSPKSPAPRPKANSHVPTTTTNLSGTESSSSQAKSNFRPKKVRSKPPPIPHIPLYDPDSDSDTFSALKKSQPKMIKAKSSPAVMRISDILTPAKSRSPSPGPGLEPRPFPMSLEYGGGVSDNGFDDNDDGYVDNDFDFNFDLGNQNYDDMGMNMNDDPFLNAAAEPPISPTPSPQKKQCRKKTAQPTSDSDADSHENRIKKSPRKSKTHISPKHPVIVSRHWDSDSEDENENENEAARPVSPSPVRRPLPEAPVSRVISKPLSGTTAKKPVHSSKANDTIIEISSGEDAPPSRKLTRPPLLVARLKNAQIRTGSTKVSSAGVKVKSALATSDLNAQSICSDDIIDLT